MLPCEKFVVAQSVKHIAKLLDFVVGLAVGRAPLERVELFVVDIKWLFVYAHQNFFAGAHLVEAATVGCALTFAVGGCRWWSFAVVVGVVVQAVEYIKH